MLKTLGIVKGVLLTERQRHHLARRLDGKSVLEWVVRQMTDCLRLDGVVVLTDSGENGAIVRPLVPVDVPVYASDAPDTLGCLAGTLEKFPAESCVFIGADWPFIDPTIIDQLVRTAEMEKNCDYAAYQFVNECFSAGRPYGLFPEWYRASTIAKINRKTNDPIHRQLPGTYFLDNQSRFHVELLPAPCGLDRFDVRLTVCDGEDWDTILDIHSALQMDAFDANKVSDFFEHHPHIRESMARANENESVTS